MTLEYFNWIIISKLRVAKSAIAFFHQPSKKKFSPPPPPIALSRFATGKYTVGQPGSRYLYLQVELKKLNSRLPELYTVRFRKEHSVGFSSEDPNYSQMLRSTSYRRALNLNLDLTGIVLLPLVLA